jgi:hypothetical protein
VRAYLLYLRDEQEVVDDRVSRREIKRDYYLHNSNRINALRQMAIRLARASGNDYLPELEAVSLGEFDQLFDAPPKAAELQTGEVLEYKFKYLGPVVARGERFYLFARLDPYEQAELRQKAEGKQQANANTSPAQKPSAGDAAQQQPTVTNRQPTPTPQPAASTPSTRPRRINTP